MGNVDHKEMNPIGGKRKEKIDLIINGFCDYYGISANELCKTANRRQGAGWKWKRFLVLILYDYTDLDMVEIMNVLGYKSYPHVSYHYNKLKEELSGELYGSQKTKLIYNELLKFLKL
jgi:hypothetical protein